MASQAKIQERLNRLLPNGIPKHIRCYDAGEKIGDRYTIVYTGNFKGRNRRCHIFGCSGNPFHPQGIGLHDDYGFIIDKPKHGHLGKKVKFETLPKNVKHAIYRDYGDFWQLDLNKNIEALEGN